MPSILSGGTCAVPHPQHLSSSPDKAGHTGVGEVPGGQKNRAGRSRTPADSCSARPSARCNKSGRRPPRFADSRCRRPRASKRLTSASDATRSQPWRSALLDLLGQHLDLTVAALLGEGSSVGQRRDTRLSLLRGDRRKSKSSTTSTARRQADWSTSATGGDDTGDGWCGCGKPPRSYASRFQAEGRRARGEQEDRGRHRDRKNASQRARSHARHQRRMVVGRGRSGSDKNMQASSAYAEDPCGADAASPAVRSWPSSAAHGAADRDHMIATDWRSFRTHGALGGGHYAGRSPRLTIKLGARRPDLP